MANGLRVVLEDVPAVRSVSMGIWVGTGSRDERPEQSGISHLLEHMFFKGTKTMTARQLAEVFDGIGGQINAFTAKEYTCYHAKVLDEHTDIALTTLAEMLFTSLMDEAELEREKGVVMEEITMYEDNPEESVHDLIVEQSFAGHPLGANILGTRESLEMIDRGQLMTYIEERYTPSNMVISVAGHIDASAVLRRIEELFGQFSRTPRTYVTGAPSFCTSQLFRAKPVEQAHVCLALPGYAYEHPHTYGMILLNNILGASSSSRLFQEIRENRGMAYSVFTYHSAFRDTGLFAIYFGANPNQAQSVLDVIEEMVQEWIAQGITAEELQKAKNQVKGSLILSLENTSSRMSRIAKNELLLQRQVDLDEMINEVERVTVHSQHDLIRELFQGPFTFVGLGPDSAPLQYSSDLPRSEDR
ncbi:MAG: pitrilysin family protein [Firmicutes bacterium]|nr:pitrilysin family protein [Bacillota bacterium]